MLEHLLEPEDEAYAHFEAALLDLLRGWRRVEGDRTVGLPEYLAGGPHGDERPVVDPLVRRILHCLGYEEAHIVYNEALLRGFPDYQVRLAEIPGNTVLIVEDKATNVVDFSSSRANDEAESPLAQLQRYVLTSGSYGRLGLLCNGRVLEGWEIGQKERHLLFRLDLVHLASGAELREADLETMKGLFRRCGRRSFERTEALLADAVRSIQLTDDDIREIWAECQAGRDLDRLRGARAARMEAAWRKTARSARTHVDQVVDTLERLIHLLEADVREQLEAALEAAAAAERLLDAQPGLPAAEVTRIELHRGLFDLDEAAYREAILFPIQRYWEEPGRYESGALLEAIAAKLRPALKRAADLPAERTMDMFGEEDREEEKSTARDRRDKAIGAVVHTAREILLAADEVRARRREIEISYRSAIIAGVSFESWRRLVTASVLTGETEAALRREFARQTAYVYIIRLLLVRICEDKGVLTRKLSNGALIEWEEDSKRYLDYASGRSHDYLCQMAYECAANLYAHFFASATLFDWYRLDQKLLVRAILALNSFNFAEVTDDLIGTAYSSYLRAGKHAQGRYYTRRPVVETMLDELGYRGGDVVGRRLADLSCGSGSFLVGAARRIIDAFRDPSGRVPDDKAADVVQEIIDDLYGIDLNPFACYLAETNLLIQTLDLLVAAQRAGRSKPIERFHIYCADALVVDPHARPDLGAHLGAIPYEHRPAEAIKARLGEYANGFDYLIGNPPYVKAAELGRYRDVIVASGDYDCLTGRWDLYVPFVELNLRLAAEGGRVCLITIDSISSASYAAKLRERILGGSTLHRIVFADRLKLFPDADWQSNRILTLSPGVPDPAHAVERLAASLGADRLVLTRIDAVAQADTQADVFTLAHRIDLDTSRSVPLGRIFYVSKGMQLNSNSDRYKDGDRVQVPPEFQVEAPPSQRWAREGDLAIFRSFTKASVTSPVRDAIHGRPYIESGNELANDGGIEDHAWLEYGDHTRVPRFIYRPTFPELYDRPKLMFGKFTGAMLDDGRRVGFFCASEGITLAVRWCDLTGVSRTSIDDSVRAEQVPRDALEASSRRFAPEYVMALFLSEPAQRWVAGGQDMKKNIYPDVVRSIPIPALDEAEQAPLIEHTRRLHDLAWRLYDLRREGVQISGSGKVIIPAATWTRRTLAAHPEIERIDLFRASAVLFELTAAHAHVPLAGARARADGSVAVGKDVVARIRPGIDDPIPVARWLAALLSELNGTFESLKRQVEVPRDRRGVQQVLDEIARTEDEVRSILDERRAIRDDIDRRAWALYGRAPSAS